MADYGAAYARPNSHQNQHYQQQQQQHPYGYRAEWEPMPATHGLATGQTPSIAHSPPPPPPPTSNNQPNGSGNGYTQSSTSPTQATGYRQHVQHPSLSGFGGAAAPNLTPSPLPQTYRPQSQSQGQAQSPQSHAQQQSLLWSALEPWMDAEYARQVCTLMRWDARVWVPLAPEDTMSTPNGGAGSGTQAANNAGYCVLTFGSAAAAGAAMAQVNNPSTSMPGTPMTMPNSTRAFVLAWAPASLAAAAAAAAAAVASAPTPTPTSILQPAPASAFQSNGAGHANSGSVSSASTGSVVSPTSPSFPGSVPATAYTGFGAGIGVGVGPQGYAKEYSIFVGDLAPETSNSDLVAVFRNPVLGLRNDRAPKFIRPFASCKSAKIMLDPVTGVSRGYGFVRFTDEADQQRALIEMHGLYCLSRPMRISPATAKFKPQPPDLSQLAAALPSLSSVSFSPATNPSPAPVSVPATVSAQNSTAITNGIPTSVSSVSLTSDQSQQGQQGPASVSVSAPIADPAAGTGYFNGAPTGAEAVYTPSSVGGGEYFQSNSALSVGQAGMPGPLTEEWKHHAHARAILGNLIGPNGEQLTSMDPYNTTVFVGGLSPLVGEETLRTFFVPFGEIHYVKVPVGKHCGFVQFVRKADAERAIEKMQGFPVGGSRIRLSWGRSQYKAAQAAAQAAQAAALQASVGVQQPQTQQQQQPLPTTAAGITPVALTGMTQEQAIMLLQKFGLSGYPVAPPNAYAPPPPPVTASVGGAYATQQQSTAAVAAGSGFQPSPSPSNSNGNGHVAEGFQQTLTQQQQPQVPPPPPPTFTEDSIKARRDEGPFVYNGQRSAYEVPSQPAGASGSFSPFSPDPNHPGQQTQQQQQSGLYTTPDLLGTRRDSYSALLPHPSKAYAPGFVHSAPGSGNGVGGGAAGGAKIPMTSPTARAYGGGFAGSPPALQINRYQGHGHPQTQPISRPHSGPARGGERGREEFESMHDLNGTLASLDLDRERELGVGDRPWSLRSPIPESMSEESTSSGGSVQFRMTMGQTPSP